MEKLEFPAFPYKPYSIQIDFMTTLYRALEKGGVAMLESPTGTGKTLSIICSVLQWVIDSKKKDDPGTTKCDNWLENGGQIGSDEEPDWMRDFVVNIESEAQEKKTNKKKSHFGLRKHEKKRVSESCWDMFSPASEKETIDEGKEKKKFPNENDAAEMNDEEFLLAEYESEEEGVLGGGKSKRKSCGANDSSSDDEDVKADESDNDEEGLKVYFCSRTHSQLSQFIKELGKTAFTSEINVLCLGSRKNLCINQDVLRLGNSTRINERCLELQKKKKSETSKVKDLGAKGRTRTTQKSSGCPMLRKYKLQKEYKNQIYQHEAMDIEDLVELGRKVGTCPYYGSRSMIPAADLVVLPYQSLFSKSSRESLGLNLKNNIIIIDEAHNLADSLISMYDAKITSSQLEDVQYSLEKYFGRFSNPLGAVNRRYIQTLMVLTRALFQPLATDNNLKRVNALQDADIVARKNPSSDCSMTINDFIFSLNIDNINLIKLLKYIKESKIIYKVSGYGDKVAALQNVSSTEDNCKNNCVEISTLSSFHAFADMLLALTNNDGDGRIIVSKSRSTSSGRQHGYLKYVMLTGEKIFSEFVEQAHAVILAGGTLQPIEETRERLFPWMPLSELQFFSCSHIVPSESILPIAVSHGPSGRSFDFSYGSRTAPSTIEELGLLISNLVTVVPEGIVVFFSSFEYENKVYDAWKNAGILERMMKKKLIFREPRRNTDVDIVLKEYKEAIERVSAGSVKDSGNQNGAIMLAVVGGKISEGINFSDGMGRCIVMVGLPYPNPSDIELLERIKHIDSLGDPNSTESSKLSDSDVYYSGDVQNGFSILRNCRRRGKEYYENLCMKAVNQSIGRAIRHINDYAAILLVDARYSQDPSKRNSSHPTNKLPQWIKQNLVSSTKRYGQVHRLLHKFFRQNKNREIQ